MASLALPAPRIVSPEELCENANASLVELTHAVRRYRHWALQLAYACIREATPLATDLLVHVDSGPPQRCHLRAVCDRAGDLLWSPGGQAGVDPLAGIDALLDGVLRWRAPQDLPGWSAQAATGGGGLYRVDLRVVPPAVDPDLGAVSPPELARHVDAVIDVLAVVVNGWTSRTIQAVSEYARGLVEGWFPPLTDITGWASVAAALGHPVPADDQFHELPGEVLDAEDWKLGIGSVHGLATGVLESADIGETVGQEDSLHVRVAFYDEDLAARALTVAELASVFRGDVRLTAAVLVQALVSASGIDHNPQGDAAATGAPPPDADDGGHLHSGICEPGAQPSGGVVCHHVRRAC